MKRQRRLKKMLQPLRGKIVVEVIPDTRRTESGIYLAETIKDIPHRGAVKNTGLPFITDKGAVKEWGFQVGEIVHFKRNWTASQGTMLILKYDEIVAVEGATAMRGFGEYTLVQRHYTGKIGDSTLIIPDVEGSRQNLENFFGLVISPGDDNIFELKAGDKILYSRNEGIEVKPSWSEKYFALKPRAVLALITSRDTS